MTSLALSFARRAQLRFKIGDARSSLAQLACRRCAERRAARSRRHPSDARKLSQREWLRGAQRDALLGIDSPATFAAPLQRNHRACETLAKHLLGKGSRACSSARGNCVEFRRSPSKVSRPPRWRPCRRCCSASRCCSWATGCRERCCRCAATWTASRRSSWACSAPPTSSASPSAACTGRCSCAAPGTSAPIWR